MGFAFISAGPKATWLAATSQTGQLTALAATFTTGPQVRYYTSAGTHLGTATHSGWDAINTGTTPYSLNLGALSAWSALANGTAAYAILAVPGGSDILRADVSLGGAVSASGARVNLDDDAGAAGLAIQATSTLPIADIPSWRAAMTSEDTLYYVTADTPEDAPLLGALPSFMGNGNESFLGAAWNTISGFASGTHLGSVGTGAFGTMVYGTGGHSNIMTGMLGVDLSADAPAWDWWQNPYYETSDTFATTGADLYYSTAAAAALVAGPRGTAARIRNGSEAADVATWDGLFPVAFEGWMIPRKMTTGQMGNNAPHGFRYASQCYLPASFTGADPLLFIMPEVQGPFSQGYSPETVSDSTWLEAASLSSGARRWPYHFKNLTTGAWTMHQWSPIGINTGFGGDRIGLFTDNKRVYVCTSIGASSGYYYLDFSAGDGTHTGPSTPVTGMLDMHGYCYGAFSDGDPQGRHFCVALASGAEHNTKLVVWDFDNATSFRIDLASDGLSYDSTGEWLGMSYDNVNHRCLLVQRNTSTGLVTYWSITIGSTLNDSAGWSAVERSLTASDAAMVNSNYTALSGDNGLAHFYGKTRFLPDLGVILLAANRHRMLGFRPSV